MEIITHENLWWWGKSYTLILDNGKAMIEVSIEDERPDAACIQSLLVHESVRQQGIANAMLTFAEDKAKNVSQRANNITWVQVPHKYNSKNIYHVRNHSDTRAGEREHARCHRSHFARL